MLRFLKNYHSKAGKAPGLLVPREPREGEQVSFQITHIRKEGVEVNPATLDEIDPEQAVADEVTWFRVTGGLHDADMLQTIGERFGMHRLTMEDVMNTGHRPKLEIYDAYLFVIAKNITHANDSIRAVPSHIAFIMGPGWLLSFEEIGIVTWRSVAERIDLNFARFLQNGVEYLLYALLDAVVDNTFGLLDVFDAMLDQIEQRLGEKVDKAALLNGYNIRRELILLRRLVVPMRDLVAQMVRGDIPEIKKETRIYLRDVLDHTEQLIDSTQIFSEIADSMVQIHLSASSQRSTDVMQTLTVIATIFIPLTFIAGVYGMNFRYMPELNWPPAYFVVWGVFAGVTVAMLRYFRKKKWI